MTVAGSSTAITTRTRLNNGRWRKGVSRSVCANANDACGSSTLGATFGIGSSTFFGRNRATDCYGIGSPIGRCSFGFSTTFSRCS